METKLSVTTGARRLSLRPLAITATLVAGFAITASGASAALQGVWTVRPGRTLQVHNMHIASNDTDTAYIDVDGSPPVVLGTNAGCFLNSSPPCAVHPSAHFYTNPADSYTTHTVTLDLYDATVGCDSFSDGPNAAASRHGLGQTWSFPINDGSENGRCEGPAPDPRTTRTSPET